MNDKHFHFWQKWLTSANVITIFVGLLVAIGDDQKQLQASYPMLMRDFRRLRGDKLA